LRKTADHVRGLGAFSAPEIALSSRRVLGVQHLDRRVASAAQLGVFGMQRLDRGERDPVLVDGRDVRRGCRSVAVTIEISATGARLFTFQRSPTTMLAMLSCRAASDRSADRLNLTIRSGRSRSSIALARSAFG
jgi:hypothetical protein